MNEIKKGDELYISTTVMYGYRSGKTFLVKRAVERTTPTQFIIDGRRFKKENLSEIGKFMSYAKLDGEDQTDELNEFRELLSISNQFYSIISRSIPAIGVDRDIKTAKKALSLLKEIQELLTE